MESFADQLKAFVLALLFHVALIFLIWWSAYWILPRHDSVAAGEPIRATLQVSAADIRRAQAAIKASPKPLAATEAAPRAQPIPEPNPQVSDTPLQMTPQAPRDRPDPVDPQRISRLAEQQAAQLAMEEREQHQRLSEPAETQRRSEAAMQVAQLQAQRVEEPVDTRVGEATGQLQAPAMSQSGSKFDEGLEARYIAAMYATARSNWNIALAPALTRCKVRFTQKVGGNVTSVEFLDCPFDSQGRDSVERALRAMPMPYAGFESVFPRYRQTTMSFCFPDDACAP